MKILTSLLIIIIFTHSSADASVISKKLQTINKNSFEIKHSTFDKNKPIILFLAGLGNRGNQINQIRDEFNDAKLNLFTFSRHENPCDSFRTCISNLARRVKTGQIIISNKGAKSSLEDIFENEITTIINYLSIVRLYFRRISSRNSYHLIRKILKTVHNKHFSNSEKSTMDLLSQVPHNLYIQLLCRHSCWKQE